MTHLRTLQFRLPLFIRVVALYVFVAAPVWVGWTEFKPTHTTVAASAVVRPVVPAMPQIKEPVSGEPTRVQVPRLGIDLTIIDGEYDPTQDSWTLTDDKAQFARMTDLPNDQAGNTFIYGHNTDAVFAKLSGLEIGDTVLITTSNNHAFSYTYNGTETIQPDKTSILSSTPKPQLTLMTCDGIFSQDRRIMYFDFVGVS